MNKISKLVFIPLGFAVIGYGAFKLLLTDKAQKDLVKTASTVSNLALEKIKDTNVRSFREEQVKLRDTKEAIEHEWQRLGY